MDVGILLLRLVAGLTMVAHGAQKLTTRWGGHGVTGTSRFVESLGFRAPRPFAVLLGGAELTGGFLLAAGLLTPLGAMLLIAVMTAAVAVVHRGKGLFASDGGFEYPLVLAAVAAAIAFTGPGAYSLDALLELPVGGASPAALAVTLGVLSGLGASALRHLPQRSRLRRPGTQAS